MNEMVCIFSLSCDLFKITLFYLVHLIFIFFIIEVEIPINDEKDFVPPSKKRAGWKKALMNEDFSEEADFRNFMNEPVQDTVSWKDTMKQGNTKQTPKQKTNDE